MAGQASGQRLDSHQHFWTLDRVERGELYPSYLATHRFSLEDGPKGYEMFKKKEDGCVRVVFAP